MSVKDTRNYSLQEKLKALNGKKVKVGIVGESDSKLLTYAAVNEYGANIKITPKMRKFLPSIGIFVKKETTHIVIPERSYIRSTFDNKKVFANLRTKLQPFLKRVLSGGNEPEDVLDFIGLNLVSAVKKTIIEMKEPENHPVSIQRKGEGKGLLRNSGRLFNAINYEVTG